VTRVTNKDPWPADGADQKAQAPPGPVPAGEHTAQRPATQREYSGIGYSKEGHGCVLITIAARWLGLSALFNLVWGFGALLSQHIAHAHYLFGILHSSGWISIILGVLQLAVAATVLMGDQLARWLGVALLALNAINQKFFIGTYPVWSALILFFDVISIYLLSRYGSRKNLAQCE
jgi:hypothetical protein